MEILKQINWVDIFVVITVLRICYIAVEKGLIIELFKLLGTVTSLYLSIHYYPALSARITDTLNFKEFNPAPFNFFAFFFLACFGYLIFSLLCGIFSKLVKLEAIPAFSRWGGLVLGAARSALLSGLVIFMLVISGVGYFHRSVASSLSGKYVFKIVTGTYSFLWENIVSKFATGENFNQTVAETQKGLIGE